MTEMRYPVLVACLLLLSGCLNGTGATFMKHYALSEQQPSTGERQRPADTGEGVLRIARITVPSWLSGTTMYYRLAYRNRSRLSPYGRSDWVSPPATLLLPLLQAVLNAGDGWQAVVGPRTPGRAGHSLHIRLDDFSQTFSRPDRSVGVLDATVTLVDNRQDRLVAQRHFHVGVPAASPDAQGGAMALSKAGRQFADQLAHWLQGVKARK